MSFGSPFGGFGQQQNQSSGFGFGSNTNNTATTSGFGSTPTFGSNTSGGLFGNTGGTGFGSTTGGFGSAGTGGFGAKPAFGASTSAGGGLFGSTTTTAGATGFGSGGAFGSTNASTSTPFGGGSTSLFGASKPAFGGTGTTSTGLFGSNTNTTSTGFGSTPSGFGATANPGIGTNVGDPPGTAAVAFQPFIEKESTTNQQTSFQNILFMDAYKKWSAEELRLADYNHGRRYGNSTGTGAFGVGSNFGGFGSNSNTTNTSTTTTGGGLFGSSNNAFGQNTATTGGFGSNTATSSGLFGAKPATTGGLFGTNTAQQPAQSTGLFGGGGAATGGFGSNTTGGFGSTTNTATTGTGLFGNTANQAKPATGFGFGSNTQATTGFGNTGTTGAFGSTPAATNTGTGLFGSATNTTNTAGGGLFGNNAQAGTATSGFGTGTAGGFGTQANQTGGLFGQSKPATGGLFGATNTATTGTTGGGLFGTAATSSPFGGANNTQSSFLQKPAATTGGLFGASTAQPAATGGLFGNLGQNNQAQQQAQQASPFGGSLLQNQQKPPLFGAAPTATNSLFSNQAANPQQTTNAFGQSLAATQQQGGMLGNSLFGNSQAAGLGASQGLTTSISDAGAYGAPSLFQSLTSAEVHNPGPLATPLSANKSKTSRRSSILPLYKMNPGSASKFATPQKRGYGFSYSTFGTPNSTGSVSSTPGSLSQSLFAGSVGRGMNKSISSSTLRRTYNADDSILLPGAFSSSSSTRFYGSTSNSKKLVINRDMRSDLFSTPTKVKDTGSEASDSLVTGSARKLTKRVSFDTSAAKATTPERNGDDADLGYIRPQGRPPSNGSGKSALNGNGSASKPAAPSTPTSEPEMTQVTGKELAIVQEEESSPSANRCIPDNYTINSKDLGEYWMSPSKEEIDRMNRVQRQQVSDFTVGRVNVGQVRFRVPVDLTKINLESILGGIVTLIIRSATVYPDVHTKPPVGQGLNVPAEIMLLHTCPRSGPDVSAVKMKKHVARLKSIPDTTFVSYDEKLAAWTFMVEHFTTYGLDEDDDETDAEATMMSTASGNDNMVDHAAPAAVRRAADSDDEGFDIRRRKRVFVPGAFDDNNNMIDDDEEDDVNTQKPSFLSNSSAEKRSLAVVPVQPTEYDEDMELSQDGAAENENEASFSRQHHTAAELDNSSLEDSPSFPRLLPDVPETPAGVVRARMRAIKESNMPLKVQVADGDNWMEMLQKTVSPQKRDRAALRTHGEMGAMNLIDFKESKADFSKSARASTAVRNRNAADNRGFATSIDLMNSLFEKAKAPAVKAPEPITIAKGFMKWPYKRQTKVTDEDEANMNPTERAYHESMKPAWGVDGTCIVVDGQDLDEDVFEQALKRVRLFSTTEDPLEGMVDHKEVVDVELVNGIPSVSTGRMPPIKTFATFCEQANRRGSANASTFEKLQGSYEQSVWELASVLFDPIDDLANAADEARVRKENLGRFWAQLVQDATTKALEQTQSLEEKAVIFLSGRKVPEACRALVDSKNFKAAALTSLIGTSNAFKKDMREQMEAWQKGDVLGEFGVPLRALYSLLAGNVAVCAGKKGAGVENHVESIVLSERFGLDWKQAFGLRLWYGTASGEGVETAVAQFVENLEQGRVPQPRPWYVGAREASISWTDPQRAVREDLLFGLLKVAGGLCRLEDVLEPENAQPSPFRFRLCWQINQALTATSNVATSAKLSAEKADTVTSAYAAEVLHSGSGKLSDDAWIHGLWVLLHLSDPTSRAQAVQDVLGRHAGLLFRSEAPRLYERLVDELKIPAAWVWQAAALYWRYEQKQPALEAECLLRASAFVEAHTIFVKELAPKAIVERNYEEIAQMLGQLQPHRHQISDWPLGGEVYSRFLDLLTLQRGGTLDGSGAGGSSNDKNNNHSNSSGSTAHVPRTRGRQQQEARQGAEQASLQLTGTVEALVSSLPSMYENAGDGRPTEVAAITEMADVVAKETMALANKGRMDLSKISRLPLTEDRRLRYSTDLAFAYYREVMAAH